MLTTRIGISMFSILAAVGLLSGATFAFFTDTANSQNNTFSTGNANLQISLDGETGPVGFGENIAGPTFNNLLPGQSETFTFWLKNSSTATLSFDLTADIDAITPDNDGDQLIDNTLLVSWVCDQNLNEDLTDDTPSGEFSPRDWLVGGNASIGSLDSNQQMICEMRGRLPSTADNTIAGQTVIFNAVYDGVQTP